MRVLIPCLVLVGIGIIMFFALWFISPTFDAELDFHNQLRSGKQHDYYTGFRKLAYDWKFKSLTREATRKERVRMKRDELLKKRGSLPDRDL